MLLDPVIVAFCMQFQNSGNTGCKVAFSQISEETKTTVTLSELQSYGENYIYKNIDPELLKGTIAVAFVLNGFKQKIIIAQIPLKPFEIDLNLGIINKTEGIKYKYEF